MNPKLIIGGVAIATALSGAGMAAAAGNGERDAQAGGRAPGALAAKADVDVYRCDGGKQKRVYNRIVNTPFTFGEGPQVSLPGAEATFRGPRRGRDTVSVTFSAETQLRNSTDGDKFDWIGLEVLLDGVPMRPVGPPSSVMAISGSPYYAMNAAQFCGKVRRGVHKITVENNLVDNGNNDNLTAWLDDYTLRVEVSQ